MKIAAIAASPGSAPHAWMATEALRRTAPALGHSLRAETDDGTGGGPTLDAADIADADVVLVATDVPVEMARFLGKPVHSVHVSDAIRDTRGVLEAAVALVPRDPAPPAEPAPPAAPEAAGMRLVGITSCPTGIAHTFMAAEALQKAAAALGHTIRVETQGSVGAKNQLTAEEIAGADAVVIAADTRVDTARFAGKRLYSTSTKEAIRAGRDVVRTALDQPLPAPSAVAAPATEEARPGPYRHLMTGVSYMLPVVIAGGLAIALAFALGGIHAGEQKGTLAAALSQIGGATAFRLFVAVLSGFIAFSIADRPGLAPGFVGGMLAHEAGAGFLGGIASGYLAGYLTRFLATRIRLPASLEGLKPVLILPFVSTVVVGLLMIYVISPPVQALNQGLNAWLLGLRGSNALVLGVLLGAMMAFDMGGPLNKAAYTFGVGLLASRVYTPMAAVMAAGMTPPLGLALAAFLFRNRFDEDDRRARGPAAAMGLAFVTEGAIPFAAKDPLRVIPALVAGSAVAGALSMLAGVQLLVPHGGFFAVIIPGAVRQLPAYIGAIVAGTAVTTAALFVLKRPVAP